MMDEGLDEDMFSEETTQPNSPFFSSPRVPGAGASPGMTSHTDTNFPMSGRSAFDAPGNRKQSVYAPFFVFCVCARVFVLTHIAWCGTASKRRRLK